MKTNKTLLICIGLAALTSIVYLQVYQYNFIEFDDNGYVTDNPNVQAGLTFNNIKWAFTTYQMANWHPLTMISHMLDCELFGLNPAGHHLVNLILHIANTLLLFLVLNAMTGGIWQSAFVAAVFAIHPLHIESVAWVAERKDVLSTLFWMLTMLAYWRYGRKSSKAWYIAALLMFALGLMSKPMVVTLPAVLLLLDYWPLKRFSGILSDQKTLVNLVIEKIPFFILSGISSVITYHAQHDAGTIISQIPPEVRTANAIVSYFKYISKTVWPDKLALYYPYVEIPLPVILIALAVLIVISVIVYRLKSSHKYLVCGWLWYLGTLVPVIGVVQVGSQSIADRYTYVPSIGLLIMAAWGIPAILKKWRHYKSALWACAIAIILALSLRSYFQLQYWHDSVTLFKHSLKVTRINNAMCFCLGQTYNKLGQYEQAVEILRQGIEVQPNDGNILRNLGLAYLNLGRYAEAINACEQAIKLNPADLQSRLYLGDAYLNSGNYQKAVETYYNLGICYGQLGQHEQAAEVFKKIIKIEPSNAQAQYNLGFALFSSGNKAGALKQYEVLKGLNTELANKFLNDINQLSKSSPK